MRRHDLPEHVSAWRLLLVITAFAIPLFGVVRLLADIEGDPDWLRRFILSGLALLLLWRSFADGFVRHHLRESCIGLFVFIQAWFASEAGNENMLEGHVLGLMLICGMAVTLLQTLSEMFFFSCFVLATITFAYHRASDPVVPASLGFAVIFTAVAGMASVTLSRVRIERDLSEARYNLEARVAERTEALAVEIIERRAAEETALQASHAKSRFLANMSHELRTPLNAILGYTELVQDELGDIERTDLVDDLERVKEGGLRLLRMIEDVLDLARVESGQLAIRNEAVNVTTLIADLAKLLEPMRARSGLPLAIDARESLVIETDPTRLSQILLNLLSNALKFTDNGSVTVRVEQRSDFVVFDVIDTGIGISAENIDKLFKPFVQIDDSPTRRRDGTGLGLLLARELAERLGGTLSARSEAGRGSVFTLTLPISSPLSPESPVDDSFSGAAPQSTPPQASTERAIAPGSA